MSRAYYNEIDPYAAQWLRNLIAGGHIAPGDVDERSIVDVRPADLAGYGQCHFFAGIGVWSYALRRAGWADDRPVWTGSCPCQPFSAAGKGGGFADERHLWPHFHWLISQCCPAVVLGEQVASKDGLAWLDLVQADLAGAGYASGAVDLCAAGVGAPHIRQRLWWCAERLADAGHRPGRELRELSSAAASYEGTPPYERRNERAGTPAYCGAVVGLADDGLGCGAEAGGPVLDTEHHPEPRSGVCGVAYASGIPGSEIAAGHDAINKQRATVGRGAEQPARPGADGRDCGGVHRGRRGEVWSASDMAGMARPGPTNGIWRDADWLFCRDGKWRPVEPGTFPLAHGATSRVGRLRAYGNAIVAQAAAEVIGAFLDIERAAA